MASGGDCLIQDEKAYIGRLYCQNKAENGGRSFSLGHSRTVDFSDSEMKTELDESVRGKDCYLIHTPIEDNTPGPELISEIARHHAAGQEKEALSLLMRYRKEARSVTENTMESLSHIEALKQGKAKSVTLVCPYLPFARQDHIVSREGINAVLLARMYHAAGLDSLIAVDLHSPQILGFFRMVNIDADNFYSSNILAQKVVEDHLQLKAHLLAKEKAQKAGKPIPKSDYCVATPDAGGTARAKKFANKLGLDIIISYKSRNYDTVNQVSEVRIIGDVKGRKVIVVDDMIDTAGTMVTVIRKLKELGCASVIIISAHAVMSGPAVARLDSLHDEGILEEAYVTDSIIRNKGFMEAHPWYREVSLAPVLAEMIYRINTDQSVSGVYLKDSL